VLSKKAAEERGEGFKVMKHVKWLYPFHSAVDMLCSFVKEAVEPSNPSSKSGVEAHPLVAGLQLACITACKGKPLVGTPGRQQIFKQHSRSDIS
jgi:hypothetical protein